MPENAHSGCTGRRLRLKAYARCRSCPRRSPRRRPLAYVPPSSSGGRAKAKRPFNYDSQPGSLPQFPRTYEQDKFIEKLTWKPAPGWQFVQSVHYESWLNRVSPTLVTPFEATTRLHGSIPAITFGHLTHTTSGNTIWDVRVGRFVYSQDNAPRATGRRPVARIG